MGWVSQNLPIYGFQPQKCVENWIHNHQFRENGQMLSNTWADHLLSDKERRQTLFGDIAKIILSLNRIKLPRIRSLTLDDDGLVKLKIDP